MTKHHSLMDSILQRPSQRYTEPAPRQRAPTNLPNASNKPDSILAGSMFSSNGLGSLSQANGTYSQAPSASGRSNTSRFSLFGKKNKRSSVYGGSVHGGASVMSGNDGASSAAHTDFSPARKGRWWESGSKNKYSSRPPSVAGSVFSDRDTSAGPPGFPHLPAGGSHARAPARYAQSDVGGPSSRIRPSASLNKGAMASMRRDSGVAPLGQQQPNLVRKSSKSAAPPMSNGSVTSQSQRVASPDFTRPVSPAASMGRVRSQSRLAQTGKSDWNSFVKSMSGTEVAQLWETMPTLAPKQSQSSLKRSSTVADRIKKELQQDAQYEQVQRDQGVVHQDLLARAAAQVIGAPPPTSAAVQQGPPLRFEPGHLVEPIRSPPTSSSHNHYIDPNAPSPKAPSPQQASPSAPPTPVPTFAPIAQAPQPKPAPAQAPVQHEVQAPPPQQRSVMPPPATAPVTAAPGQAPTTAVLLAQQVEKHQPEEESEESKESEESSEEEETESSSDEEVSRQTLDVVAEEDEDGSSNGHSIPGFQEMRMPHVKKGKTLSRSYGDYAAPSRAIQTSSQPESSTPSQDAQPASTSAPAIAITKAVVPDSTLTQEPHLAPVDVPTHVAADESESDDESIEERVTVSTAQEQQVRPALVSRDSNLSGYQTAASGATTPNDNSDAEDAEEDDSADATTIASTQRDDSVHSGRSDDTQVRDGSQTGPDRLRQMDVGEDFFGPSIANILDSFNQMNYSDTTINRSGLDPNDLPAARAKREAALAANEAERTMYDVRQKRADATAIATAKGDKRASNGTDVAPSFAALWLLNQSGSDTPAGEEVPVIATAVLPSSTSAGEVEASTLSTPASTYASQYSQAATTPAAVVPTVTVSAKPLESVLNRSRPKTARNKKDYDDVDSDLEAEQTAIKESSAVPAAQDVADTKPVSQQETSPATVANGDLAQQADLPPSNVAQVEQAREAVIMSETPQEAAAQDEPLQGAVEQVERPQEVVKRAEPQEEAASVVAAPAPPTPSTESGMKRLPSQSSINTFASTTTTPVTSPSKTKQSPTKSSPKPKTRSLADTLFGIRSPAKEKEKQEKKERKELEKKQKKEDKLEKERAKAKRRAPADSVTNRSSRIDSSVDPPVKAVKSAASQGKQRAVDPQDLSKDVPPIPTTTAESDDQPLPTSQTMDGMPTPYQSMANGFPSEQFHSANDFKVLSNVEVPDRTVEAAAPMPETKQMPSETTAPSEAPAMRIVAMPPPTDPEELMRQANNDLTPLGKPPTAPGVGINLIPPTPPALESRNSYTASRAPATASISETEGETVERPGLISRSSSQRTAGKSSNSGHKDSGAAVSRSKSTSTVKKGNWQEYTGTGLSLPPGLIATTISSSKKKRSTTHDAAAAQRQQLAIDTQSNTPSSISAVPIYPGTIVPSEQVRHLSTIEEPSESYSPIARSSTSSRRRTTVSPAVSQSPTMSRLVSDAPPVPRIPVGYQGLSPAMASTSQMYAQDGSSTDSVSSSRSISPAPSAVPSQSGRSNVSHVSSSLHSTSRNSPRADFAYVNHHELSPYAKKMRSLSPSPSVPTMSQTTGRHSLMSAINEWESQVPDSSEDQQEFSPFPSRPTSPYPPLPVSTVSRGSSVISSVSSPSVVRNAPLGASTNQYLHPPIARSRMFAEDQASIAASGTNGTVKGYNPSVAGSVASSVSSPPSMSQSAFSMASTLPTSMPTVPTSYRPNKDPKRFANNADDLLNSRTTMMTIAVSSGAFPTRNRSVRRKKSSDTNGDGIPGHLVDELSLTTLSLTAHTPPPRKMTSQQVLVQVIAVAIDEMDKLLLRERVRSENAFGFVPGRSFCGRVVECGYEVKKMRKGDIVFGLQDSRKSGALAEFMTIDHNLICQAPSDCLTTEQIAALPSAGVMAYQLLQNHCRSLSRGARVLILNAHDGVGLLTMQESAGLGLIIVAQCPPSVSDGVAVCQANGAHEVVLGEPLWAINSLHESSFDLVVDTVGGRRIYDASRRILAYEGQFCTCYGDEHTTANPNLKSHFRSLRRAFFKKDKKTIGYEWVGVDTGDDCREALEAVKRAAEAGNVCPRLRSILPFADAPRAFDTNTTRSTEGEPGAIVVRVS